ncbi:MAG: DUF4012 domain-containing protein [Candidatus Dormibacteraeota bacterium]|nr:DUF4012 domain-containing protein [Candidatus Dormibacteraeota bacterium]
MLRHHPRLTFAGLSVVLAVLFVAAVALRGLALYTQARQVSAYLQDALAAVEEGGFEVTADQAQRAAGDIAKADASAAELASALAGDPVIAVARLVPGLGAQVDDAATLVRAGRLITSRHTAIRQLLQDYVEAQTSGQGRERLAAVVRFVAEHRDQTGELVAAFNEADNRVATTHEDSLMAPLAQVRRAMDRQIERARPLVDAWQLAQDVVPSAMGVGEPRRYIVFALDNAEVRPVGGLMAAFATPTFRKGLLEDFTFRDIYDIDKVDQEEYVKPPEPLAGHLLGNVTWQVADAGWWPEFALSASEARRMYAIETDDTNLDGTIAFTPELVDALLRIVGPVEIPGAGITVHAGETYLVSLKQVETLNRGPGRKRFLAELASEVVQRLFALPANRYPEVLGALGQAGKRRQLQIFLDDPAAQATIEKLGWYTPFSVPSDGDRLSIMEANVAPASKLDVLLDLDHSLDVTLTSDGNAEERLVTTYTNRFGPNLPPKLRAVGHAFRFGNLGSYQRRYLIPGAYGISVSSDGMPPLTGPERVEQAFGSLSVGNYQLIRPGVTHLETSYLAPQVVVSESDPSKEGTYRLSFFKQPGRDHDTLNVTVSVPPGTEPVSWSDGGSVSGNKVSFSTTTEFDRYFEVRYAAD